MLINFDPNHRLEVDAERRGLLDYGSESGMGRIHSYFIIAGRNYIRSI